MKFISLIIAHLVLLTAASWAAVGVKGDEGVIGPIEPDQYIYDDNWNYSIPLNDQNWMYVNEAIGAGKTVIVRWTAGKYCGSCAKQAPAWDDAIRLFTNHSNIIFGDVDVKAPGTTMLSGPPHNPGVDGWPTIRYFNDPTGIDGASYTQKTAHLKKWEELGPDHFMFLIEFIEEVSGTPLCDIPTGHNCDDRSKRFLSYVKMQSPAEMKQTLDEILMIESILRKNWNEKRDLWLLKRKYLMLHLVGNSIFNENNKDTYWQ